MGASIYFQPEKGTHLSVGARSRFLGLLREAFGIDSLWHLTEECEPALQRLRSKEGDESIQHALDTLIATIREHGAVFVWAVF
jgi:hypothetical protein